MYAPKIENKVKTPVSAGLPVAAQEGARKAIRYEDNRPATVAQGGMLMQRRLRRAMNDGSAVEQAGQAHDMAAGEVVQRVVGNYKPGTTLAVTTHAMRNLSLKQMQIVQQLHDDPNNTYTIDQARQIATGVSTASNPYEWEVTGIGNFATTEPGVQDILTTFGHPTQSVVKTYEDLADRVGFDVGKNRKGALSSSTIQDLHAQFEASVPLHVGFNPFLNAAWTGNLDDYTGAKTGIPLYSVMRSEITKDFVAESLGNVTLNDVLKEVSGKPSEVHHLMFKALHPDIANTPENLMLTERSERESVYGPGQHELMHKVATGNHKDKFRQLLPQYEAEYGKWVKSKTGKTIV